MYNMNKKGFLALESLTSIILSVIALVFLFQLFINFFLQTPTNENIAEQNAKSMSDFVNYFTTSPDYKNMNNCFNILKLEKLTNFQFYTDNYKDNYDYIIDNKAIYVVKHSSKEQIFISGEYEKYRVAKFPFEKEMKIVYDNTDNWDLNWITSIGLITDELTLELENKPSENKFYYLEPNLASTGEKILSDIDFLSDETNKYKITFMDKKNLQKEDLSLGSYLVYSNKFIGNNFDLSNFIFVVNSKYSYPQIRSKLCSKKLVSKIEIEKNYKKDSGIGIDFINKHIIFEPILKQDGTKIYFEWKNGPVCLENKNEVCLNYLGQDYFNLKYQEFITKIRNLVGKNEFIGQSLVVKEIIELDFSQIKGIINFEEVFIDNKKVKVGLTSKEKIDLNIFDIDSKFVGFSFWNRNINNCDGNEDCNDILYQNPNLYFFIEYTNLNKDTMVFYSFEQVFLRKEKIMNQDNKYKLYLGNKEIDYKIISSEGYSKEIPLFENDDQNLYLLELNNIIKKDGEFMDKVSVLLSPSQFISIPEKEDFRK